VNIFVKGNGIFEYRAKRISMAAVPPASITAFPRCKAPRWLQIPARWHP
jgi:hypothetical protein